MRKMDHNNLSDEDLQWIFANYPNEEARAKFGVTPDMSNVPPTPPASQLDESGRRHTVPEGQERPPRALDDQGQDEPPDYESWKKVELQAELKRRGFTITGREKNDELIQLLRSDDEEVPYSEWPDQVLREECRTRGLDAKDLSHTEMVEWLEAYDVKAEAEEDEQSGS